ncbi:hypothetical protein [Cupriavidus sp. D39]|uniref:hypothetical protein n=1 Tax=Cupriavidus sp. D39 TaxID=2997877 RepID=UPI00226E3329|nr:hypothetical protein [Cupriavidus sp. D39]MCY0854012.1 hypothetical protein [Cupriavidus sp. D39]
MSRQTLRDAHAHVIGYIDTDARGVQTARDSHLHLVGRYEPQHDVTRDDHARLIGSANQFPALIAVAAES